MHSSALSPLTTTYGVFCRLKNWQIGQYIEACSGAKPEHIEHDNYIVMPKPVRGICLACSCPAFESLHITSSKGYMWYQLLYAV